MGLRLIIQALIGVIILALEHGIMSLLCMMRQNILLSFLWMEFHKHPKTLSEHLFITDLRLSVSRETQTMEEVILMGKLMMSGYGQ